MKVLLLWGGLAVAWLTLVGFGFRELAREQLTPGAGAAIPAGSFPSGTSISLSSSAPTLVVFLHPYCPCSRATLHELQLVLAEAKTKVTTNFVFTVPAGLPGDWKKSGLWQSALQVAGTRVLEDGQGREAHAFGATTSGDCFLYSEQGRLLYHGGVTALRGHEGPNRGEEALREVIGNGRVATFNAPAFGCSLL